MLPKVEGIESLAAILRDRRERLFHDFVSALAGRGQQGHLGRARARALGRPQR